MSSQGTRIFLTSDGNGSVGQIGTPIDNSQSMESLMVAGSCIRQELSVAASIVIDEANHGDNYPYDKLPCSICKHEIGKNVEGREFVPCECAFRICRKCYEYIRSHEGGRCPQCNSKYRRVKGSPSVPGDNSDDVLSYLEEKVSHEEKEETKNTSKLSKTSKVTKNKHKEETQSLELSQVDNIKSSELSISIPSSSAYAFEYTTKSAEILDPTKKMDDYGYGSIVWVGNRTKSGNIEVEEEDKEEDDDDELTNLKVDDSRRPLSRKVPISSSLLNPYRFMVVLRFFVMIAFFWFRATNPNDDAWFLWFFSVVCEIWFGLSWIFDQLPKWSPITRETYLDRLAKRYEPEGEPSHLPNVDVFVSTADAEKEPPLVTANVILSILAADYPVEKISCYLSDDGAAMVTFEALTETANFARSWVPFCKKFEVEPRAPEMYFSQNVDYLKDQVHVEFVRERRRMKREYDQFKIRINGLVANSHNPPKDGWLMPDGTPWPGNLRSDHAAMIQVFLQPEGETKDVNGDPLPRLVYMSREKRPGYDHNKKAGAMNALMRSSGLITNAPFILNLDCDHYINNSKAIREGICFLIDPLKGSHVCYVQFPQRFDGVDRNDRYANHNTIFYDVNMKGLDGQQGPMYVGTGCMFRRQALYGFHPPPKEQKKGRICCCPPFSSRNKSKKEKHDAGEGEGEGEGEENMKHEDIHMQEKQELKGLIPGRQHVKRFGLCYNFISTTFDIIGGKMAVPDAHEVLSDVILVISCGYEDNTEWGKSCGWIYGSVTEDIVTGYMMHTRGWRSVYCIPRRHAFKGSAPINLTDRLAQVLRWATGSVEIFFSSVNPMWAHHCTGLKPIQRMAYVNTAVYPFTSIALVVYCFLPAIGLFTNQFIVKNITNWAVFYYLLLFMTIFATALLEIRWSGVSLEEWWRNEQFWIIGGISSHLAAVLQGFLKVFAGVDIQFTLTTKASEGEDDMEELYTIRWTWLFLVPITVVLVNFFAILAGIANAINRSKIVLGELFGQVFFSVWVLLHLYPFVKGLMGRSQKMPTIVVVWSLLVAIILSLFWANLAKN